MENIIRWRRNRDRKTPARETDEGKILAVEWGAMSDEIIHLEEVIRERIRFGDAGTT